MRMKNSPVAFAHPRKASRSGFFAAPRGRIEPFALDHGDVTRMARALPYRYAFWLAPVSLA
jgi:hypothetical protein